MNLIQLHLKEILLKKPQLPHLVLDLEKLLFLALLGAFIFPSAASAAATFVLVIGNIASAVQIAAVSLVVIFWIITGILFLIAQGAPEKLNAAKKSFIWTIAGTALVILAQAAGAIIRNALFLGV